MNMNRKLLFLLPLFFSIKTLFAQVAFPAYTHEMINQTLSDVVYIESDGKQVSQEILYKHKCFLQINNSWFANLQGFKNQDFSASELKDKDIIVSSQIGRAVSLKIPISIFSELHKLKGISYLEIPADLQPFLERAVGDVRADSVHAGIGLETGFSGKDVIMGVIDWGFDFTHPMFYDTALNRNRIIACWDHWKKSGPAPTKYGYGTVWKGTDQLLAAGSDTANDRGYDTHGSHVAGIAGGGGAGIGLKGVAYDCDFLFVQVDWRTGTFLDCVDWMYEEARAVGKRLVINMSFGSYHRAALDSTTFFNEVIKEYTKKGVVMVTSSGNNGSNKFHIKKVFASQLDTLKTGISMLPNNTSFPRFWGHTVISWGRPYTSISTAFDIYDNSNTPIYIGEMIHSQNFPANTDTFLTIGNDTLYYIIECEKQHPMNNKPQLVLKFRKTNNNWRVAIRSSSSAGNEVHYWHVIQNTNGTSNTGQPLTAFQPSWLAGDDSFAVSDPAVVPYVITVGAHNSETRQANGNTFPGVIANFSSQGPTMDGLIKPDVSGPGVGVLSSVSSYTTNSFQTEATAEFNGITYPFARFSGTSMSGPAVAGVVALMLEANPELTHNQIHQILIQTAREDIRTGELPPSGNNTWGSGKVDANAAVKMALQMKGDWYAKGNKVIYPNPSNGNVFYQGSIVDENYPVKVYNLQGQLVLESTIGFLKSISVSGLSDGVYIFRIYDGEWFSQRFLVGN